MSKLTVISSGSIGNSYILECGGEQLLIELGVLWKNIIGGLNYDIKKVAGCIVSHKHLDHSLAIPNALKLGLSVFSNEDVQSIHPQVKVLKTGLKTQIGGFRVQPIELNHSVTCYGYIIETKHGEKIVFATDCSEFLYKIRNAHCFMIEANYSDEERINNACNDEMSSSFSENHLELKQTIQALKDNFSASLNTIVLLHLSQGNANPKKFAKRVKDELGFENVYVARKGLTIEINKEEF